jgi:hypothetical protein
MCERCAEIDAKIIHYTRINSGMTDQLTRQRIAALIQEWKEAKSGLHQSGD